MLTGTGPNTAGQADHVWHALANPLRRQLLDELGRGPRTTGELCAGVDRLSRFAVMQHLDVLEDAGLVVVRRRGRQRFNHLNPVPLRRWYERWVIPLADSAAAEMTALERHVATTQETEGEEPVPAMTPATSEEVRSMRIETELRFKTTPERLFSAFADESLKWFPSTYGEGRVKGIVLEPRVGGAHYEDWGNGMGYMYGQVMVYDRPTRLATRGRIMPGTIIDTDYRFDAEGEETVLRVSRVVIGPLSDEDIAGIRMYGDIAMFEAPLRKLVEGAA